MPCVNHFTSAGRLRVIAVNCRYLNNLAQREGEVGDARSAAAIPHLTPTLSAPRAGRRNIGRLLLSPGGPVLRSARCAAR